MGRVEKVMEMNEDGEVEKDGVCMDRGVGMGREMRRGIWMRVKRD